MYNALEWHNFIADTREESENPSASLEDLFDEIYGDEFWFEVAPYAKNVYQVAFDLASEEFVICDSDTEVDFVMTMAEDGGSEEELFWAE